MKKLLFSFLLFFPILVFGQVISVANKQFGIISDLRSQAGSDKVVVKVSGMTTVGDQNSGDYYWDVNSTATDDGFITIKVTNVTTGRWIRIPNANTIKGTSTFSALTLQTSYVINHGLPFTPLQVYIQPMSANAAVPSWVSNINSTSFTVNFSTVPILGTLNLSINWLVIKQ